MELMKKNIKKIAKGIGIVVGVLLLAVIGLLGYLSVKEYRPEAREAALVSEEVSPTAVELESSLTLLSYNIGYGCLSAEEDFFMDGGSKVRPDEEGVVQKNIEGILSELKENPVDIYLLQEVDLDSKRSYRHDQRLELQEALGYNSYFAYNFNCEYVPFPLPTIGKVKSGLVTLTDKKVTEATRIALPVPFKWPVRMANLKRCLLETRLPIAGSDKELVVLNLHLEAYDSGEGKAAQTEILMKRLEEERELGNYVIAGGDFNQTTPAWLEKYPTIDEDKWTPGMFDEASIPEGFRLLMDGDKPTSRLNDTPLTKTTQKAVIDGFIVSDEVEVLELATLDYGFMHADHSPVRLTVKLIED
ncbi:endonuclease/exonuclease/phosphatase family metal-dependent hydrolase [Lachnospiraceae bacterium PF1-22]|uniref:endonuclease/exonuclease/phosphatase family protein n=1 Tax=Ohessyouella blattaphilus TaxID=2949333 RepID=UPI0025600303|nr:endonuclease [Lachnospiraceae bacterium OttesenSCG-928-J05]